MNRETLNTISSKSIDYITNLIVDADIAKDKDEVYSILGCVAVIILEFIYKQNPSYSDK